MKTRSIREPISVVRLRNMKNIWKNIKIGIDTIGGLNLSRDSAVVIKPNLCCIKPPETGATTDVKVVEAVINYLRNEFGISDISVVESDGTQVLADIAFKLLGYEELSKRSNIKLVNLSKSPFSVKKFPKNAFLKEIKIPHIMESANFLISIPKIKSHNSCFFTATLKNQFGCNPVPRKVKYHKRLDDAIVDLCFAFKPNLVVVDGIIAMEGYGGPTDGVPVRMNTLLFGWDPVAVDCAIAELICLNPEKVRYLAEARSRKLGKGEYKILGADPNEIRGDFKICGPPKWHNLYGLLR